MKDLINIFFKSVHFILEFWLKSNVKSLENAWYFSSF